MTVRVKKDIFGFEISIDNSLLVEVIKRKNQLSGIESDHI